MKFKSLMCAQRQHYRESAIHLWSVWPASGCATFRMLADRKFEEFLSPQHRHWARKGNFLHAEGLRRAECWKSAPSWALDPWLDCLRPITRIDATTEFRDLIACNEPFGAHVGLHLLQRGRRKSQPSSRYYHMQVIIGHFALGSTLTTVSWSTEVDGATSVSSFTDVKQKKRLNYARAVM